MKTWSYLPPTPPFFTAIDKWTLEKFKKHIQRVNIIRCFVDERQNFTNKFVDLTQFAQDPEDNFLIEFKFGGD